MRGLLIAVAVCFSAGAIQAQLPAQKGKENKGDRPTKAPEGKSVVSEPTKVPATTLTPKGGGHSGGVVTAIAATDYMIGVQGYANDTGIVVMATVAVADQNQKGKKRCPVGEIEVDFKGNGKLVKVLLEPGDVITAVDGFSTKTLDELVVAINTASNPHAMDITWIDWRSGNEYTGTINALKKKK